MRVPVSRNNTALHRACNTSEKCYLSALGLRGHRDPARTRAALEESEVPERVSYVWTVQVETLPRYAARRTPSIPRTLERQPGNAALWNISLRALSGSREGPDPIALGLAKELPDRFESLMPKIQTGL